MNISLALWHPRHAHAPSDAQAAREKGRIATGSEGMEAAESKARIERKPGLCGGSPLIRRAEQGQCGREKKVRERPIWIGLNTPAQPGDRFGVGIELQLSAGHKHHPPVSGGVTRDKRNASWI